jgi:uncharacterized protein (DUF1697 family)
MLHAPFHLMPTFIALLRGINVSGHRIIKMATLKESCEAMGCTRVRTYLNSGNVIFDAKKGTARQHAEAMEKCILKDFGHEVTVMVKTPAELSRLITANPFAKHAGAEGKFLHGMLLSEKPKVSSLEDLKLPATPGEEVRLIGDVLYLFLPQGAGKTKLSNALLERKLGVSGTARNWNTIMALEKLASE